MRILTFILMTFFLITAVNAKTISIDSLEETTSLTVLEKETAIGNTNADDRCQNIVRRLENYSQGRANLDNSLLNIMYEISSVMHSWYARLSSYYGQTVRIGYGAFDAINSTANLTERNASTYSRNSLQYRQELNNIIVDASYCLEK